MIVVAGSLICMAAAHAQENRTTATAAGQNQGSPIYDIPVEPMQAGIGGTQAKSLREYKGKVLLIVNVASKCGRTPQYEDLQALFEKYKDRGLMVLGFPSNDFKEQEPGSEKEIVEFCKANYGVTFPLFAKVVIKGEQKSPLYKYLQEGNHPGRAEVDWNFSKYLVGRDGKVVAHYPSKTVPDDPELIAAIEQELEKK